MSEQKTHYAWWILATACALMAGASGTAASTLGVFLRPFSQAANVGIGTMALFITIAFLVMTIVNPFAGRLLKKYNIRVVLSGCTVGLVLTMVAMSQFTSIIQFYIAAVFYGIFQAPLLYLAAPILLNNWFKKKLGFALGLMAAFSGLFGAIVAQVAGILITAYGWRTTYIIMAAIVAVVVLPFTLFVVRLNPADKGLLAYGADEAAGGQTGSVQITGVMRAEAVKSGSFYLLLIFGALLALYSGMQANIAVYAGSLGLSTTLGATTTSVLMIGSIVGKLLLGYLNDKLGALRSIFIYVVLGLIGITLLISGKSGVTVLLTGAFIFGVCMSLALIQPPVLARTIFGVKDYGEIYPLLAMSFSLFNAVAAPFYGFIYDLQKSYIPALYVEIVITVLLFFIAWLALKVGKKLQFK